MARRFATLHLAADGEQVLFMVDKNEEGKARIRAVTTIDNGDNLFIHSLVFANPEMAYRSVELYGSEQVELVRSLALKIVPPCDGTA